MPSSTSSSSPREGRRFVAQCSLFAALLVALHLGRALVSGPGDLPPQVATVQQAAETGDVLFLGDSTLFMGDPDEPDTPTTPQMLDALLPDLRVIEASSAASNVELYAAVADYLANRPDTSIRYVVFPINLRLFAPQLETSPYRNFERETWFLRNDHLLAQAAYRPLAIFKVFRPAQPSIQAFRDAPVLDGDTDLGPLGEFDPRESIPVAPDQRMRIIQFSYMASLHDDNPYVAHFVDTLRALRQANIEPIVYVTPIDYEACEQDIGPAFRERIAEKIAVLAQSAEPFDVDLIDLSTAVATDDFAWDHYPNEHLNAAGRNLIAERVATAIRQP